MIVNTEGDCGHAAAGNIIIIRELYLMITSLNNYIIRYHIIILVSNTQVGGTNMIIEGWHRK